MSESSLCGGIRRRSSYNQQKNQRQKCRHCGDFQHGPNSQEDRKKHCKAWGKACDKCHKLHHLAKVCYSAKASPIEAATAADTATNDVAISGISANYSVSKFLALEAGSDQNATLPNSPTYLPLSSHIYDSQHMDQSKPYPCHTMSMTELEGGIRPDQRIAPASLPSSHCGQASLCRAWSKPTQT